MVYTALGLLAVYYGLNRQSKLSFLFFALAFSFKLQTVFFLPVALALLFTERIRLRDVWVFSPCFSCCCCLPFLPADRCWRRFPFTTSRPHTTNGCI